MRTGSALKRMLAARCARNCFCDMPGACTTTEASMLLNAAITFSKSRDFGLR